MAFLRNIICGGEEVFFFFSFQADGFSSYISVSVRFIDQHHKNYSEKNIGLEAAAKFTFK